ncbi:alcohol oxidase [Sarocladium strictum]
MLTSAWSALMLATAATAATVQETYDYVIVGGGTAGGALATRLSQGLPKSKILLLEAGPSALEELRINVPGMRGSILGSEYDWNFTTVPQTALDGRVIDVNRGRVLGGSSAMNYLCYDRASSAEYDAWGEMGSPGWGWENMIGAMVRSENFTGNDGDVHGECGPIQSSYSRIVPEAIEGWQDTVSKLGVPVNDGGSLGGKPVGVMFQPTNIDVRDHTRSYSANSYLPLAGSNLVVKTNAPVAKILFTDRNGVVASGVQLADGSKITARKEVILSAGSIQSPGLLEVSGIGQKSVLQQAGIKQVVDLPGVGENLQDHIRTSNTYRLKEGYESFDPIIYDQSNPWVGEQLDLWFQNEKSWFDYTSSAYSFVNWGQVSKKVDTDLRNLAKNAVTAGGNSVIDKKKFEHLSDPEVPQLEILMDANYVGAAGYPGGKFITIFACVMHPMSRGSVHINTKTPSGKPLIDLKYFTNEYDIKAMIEGAKFARKIANTKPLSDVWEAEYEPGPEVKTDKQFRDWAIKAVNSFYHPIGTCAMLPKKDGGVVDKDLLVHGVKNLRVVDASIIPIQMSGHIQTAVYGIAETAAQKIIAAAA